MDREGFILAVAELIQHNYPVNNPDGMLAARVGVLIGRAYPNVDLQSVGFNKLRFLLEALVRRGIVRTGHNRKNAFAIWLCDSPAPSESKTIEPLIGLSTLPVLASQKVLLLSTLKNPLTMVGVRTARTSCRGCE